MARIVGVPRLPTRTSRPCLWVRCPQARTGHDSWFRSESARALSPRQELVHTGGDRTWPCGRIAVAAGSRRARAATRRTSRMSAPGRMLRLDGCVNVRDLRGTRPTFCSPEHRSSLDASRPPCAVVPLSHGRRSWASVRLMPCSWTTPIATLKSPGCFGMTRRPPLVGLEAFAECRGSPPGSVSGARRPERPRAERRREYLQFPPFGPDHLDNSLQHLSDLVAQVWRP